MKKIFGLIAALVVMSGCDDGDMSYKTFDFSSVPNPTECNNEDLALNTYYKVSGTEALILELPKSTLLKKSTLNPVTNKEEPQIIEINSTNKLTYKNFTSKPTAGICSLSTTPPVAEKGVWTGEGKLSVITRPSYNLTTGKLEGFTHRVTIVNVSFTNGDETITVNNNDFGNIGSLYGFTFDFSIAPANIPSLAKCTSGDTTLLTIKADQSLVLSFPALEDVLIHEVGEQTYPINATNVLRYTIFESTVTPSRICDSGNGQPVINIEQQWIALNGNVTVKTSETAGAYQHELYISGVTLQNVTTGETLLLADIATKQEDGTYFYGRITY